MLGAVPITVTRFEPGAYIEGYWVDGPSSIFEVLASVQPLSGRELANMDDGERARGPMRVYSETQLRTVDDVAGTKADRIHWSGRDYEVHSVEDWTAFYPPHWKHVVLLVEQGPADNDREHDDGD